MAPSQIDKVSALFEEAVSQLKSNGAIPNDWNNISQITRSKNPEHGEFASNIALTAAKPAKTNPRALAEQIITALPDNDSIDKLEIAGPGFINIFLNDNAKYEVLDTIFAKQQRYGLSDEFAGKKVQVEFVSANPTSSLHVGHGRGAAIGMSVGNLLEAVGWEVQREYYVNDAGRQMDILATSTYLRYIESHGEQVAFPSGGYQGDYVKDIAQSITQKYGDKYVHDFATVTKDTPEDSKFEIDRNGEKVQISGDKDKHIDGLIENSKQALGEAYDIFADTALNSILDDIKDDLGEFGVKFDKWFSEKSIQADIEPSLEVLEQRGHLYKKDGNLWFRSTDFGDVKDRVLVRANGQGTYFASDVAYHRNKFERGFDKVINVWGADHHGYIKRVKSAISALGIDEDRLDVILVQFVTLYRGEEKVQMSSRSGQFVTLRELREEVGNDAARFYYVARKSDVHVDFDLELAKSQNKDNFLYYIQYAHARVCRVLEKLEEKGFGVDDKAGRENQHLLNTEAENELIKLLAAYPDTIRRAAIAYEPHVLTNYLKDLASQFHGWYNDNRIIPLSIFDDEQPTEKEIAMMQARLRLSKAVRQVIANGLELLNLSAPTKM